MATVTFTVSSTATLGPAKISFDFDPNDKTKTTDSNVVEHGTVVDLLTSAPDGNYTIADGSCSGSTSPAPSGSDTTFVVCDLGWLTTWDVSTADALCRAHLAARRLGCRIVFRNVPLEFRELLDYMGLAGVICGDAGVIPPAPAAVRRAGSTSRYPGRTSSGRSDRRRSR